MVTSVWVFFVEFYCISKPFYGTFRAFVQFISHKIIFKDKTTEIRMKYELEITKFDCIVVIMKNEN